MQTLAPAPSRPRVGVRRSSGTPLSVDHRVEAVAAVSAAVCVVVASSSPTGAWLFDVGYRAAFGAGIVLASTRARRWTLLPFSGIAAVAAAPLLAQLAAFASLCVAVRSLFQPKRHRVTNGVVAALGAPGILLLGASPIQRLFGSAGIDRTGVSLAIAVVATAPLVVSAWSRLGRRSRNRVRLWVRRLGLAATGALVLALLAGALAFFPARGAVEHSRAAGAAGSDGDLAAASDHVDAAAAGWASAHRRLNGPWMWPVRALPGLGQHAGLLQSSVRSAAKLSAATAPVVAQIDGREFASDGRIDTAALGELAPSVDRMAEATLETQASLRSVRSPWLVPPASGALEEALAAVARAADVTAAASAAVRAGHDLLGSPTGSTIVVMFSTPAEARGSGGFIGNWAEFSAVDGRVELVEQYRSKELNDALIDTGASLTGNAEYSNRYERFAVEEHIQDITLSPDFPSVAAVGAQLFEKAVGRPVDAMVMIDPFVLETLLAFSGPVEADGLVLTGSNAAEELLRGQYERFEEDEADRTALLDGLAVTVVERLLAEPPDPLAFVQEMAPLAGQGRISMWMASDEQGLAVDALGVSGRFPTGADDVFGLVHQNAAQNKIDTFLRRSIVLATTIDATSARVHHEVEIRLDNDAPEQGLPPAIIGSNDQGLPLGTNRMVLSLYSPFAMSDVELDGTVVPVETQREFGVFVHTVVVSLAPESAATLRFELSGDVDLSDGYSVDLPVQPLAQPDALTWTIARSDRSVPSPPHGWSLDGARLTFAEPLTTSKSFLFELTD